MQQEAALELGRYAGDTARLVTQEVHALHAAILDRSYGVARRIVGPAVDPLHHAHADATRAVYDLVGLGLAAAGRLGGLVAARAVTMPESPRMANVVAAINGIHGDELRSRTSALDVGMTVRHEGTAVPVTPAALRTTFSAATSRLVVFLHGLIETEHWWARDAAAQWGEPGVTYGTRLLADAAWTPIYLRYNTGARIAENGRLLAGLLGSLLAHWPVPVSEVALVGHSMGGLVIHSALAHAAHGDGWPARVSSTVTIATPHGGAPLARAAVLVGEALALLPETRWLGNILDTRSIGIRDLAKGSIVDDPHASVPLAPGIRHRSVVATVPRDPASAAARLVGDLLVLPHHARPAPHRGSVQQSDIHELGGIHHLSVLNHPSVYTALRDWLGGAPQDTRPVSGRG